MNTATKQKKRRDDWLAGLIHSFSNNDETELLNYKMVQTTNITMFVCFHLYALTLCIYVCFCTPIYTGNANV